MDYPGWRRKGTQVQGDVYVLVLALEAIQFCTVNEILTIFSLFCSQLVEEAADSVSKYMVTRPENGNDNLAILGLVQSSSKTINTEMEHLVSYFFTIPYLL